MQAAGMDIKRSRHAQAAIKWREEGSKKGNFSASMEEVRAVVFCRHLQPRNACDVQNRCAKCACSTSSKTSVSIVKTAKKRAS